MTVPFFLEIALEPLKAKHAARVRAKEAARKKALAEYRLMLEREMQRRKRDEQMGFWPYTRSHRFYD